MLFFCFLLIPKMENMGVFFKILGGKLCLQKYYIPNYSLFPFYLFWILSISIQQRLLCHACTRSYFFALLFGNAWCVMQDWLFFSLTLSLSLSLSLSISLSFSIFSPLLLRIYGRFRPCFSRIFHYASIAR